MGLQRRSAVTAPQSRSARDNRESQTQEQSSQIPSAGMSTVERSLTSGVPVQVGGVDELEQEEHMKTQPGAKQQFRMGTHQAWLRRGGSGRRRQSDSSQGGSDLFWVQPAALDQGFDYLHVVNLRRRII